MRRAFFFVLAFLWALFCSTASSQTADAAGAPQQGSNSYYVWNGHTLQAVSGDPAGANYTEWQVWLYPRGMHVSGSVSGLAYARWGAMQGPSARAVTKQLASYQQFERAYTNFFGANTW